MFTGKETHLASRLAGATQAVSPDQIRRSRQNVKHWFAAHAATVSWAGLETDMGPLMLFKREGALVRLCFGSTPADLEVDTFSRDHLEHNPDALEGDLDQLSAYFAGQLTSFDLDLDLSGLTEFQAQVLQAAARIPYGQTLSYLQLAARLGRPRSSRAVGQALAGNPIPILIPCHRVIASSGALGGYAGGLDWKRRLLIHEGALAF